MSSLRPLKVWSKPELRRLRFGAVATIAERNMERAELFEEARASAATGQQREKFYHLAERHWRMAGIANAIAVDKCCE